MSQEKSVAVEIFKQTYQLGTSEGRDAEYIRRAAAYLDEKMQQAAAEVGNRAPLDIAILAALNIAEEVLSARQQKDSLLDQADAHIDSFTQLLSNAESSEDPPPPK
jgi:cell division protein ZapA